MTRAAVTAAAVVAMLSAWPTRAGAQPPVPPASAAAFVPLVDDQLQLLITPSADGHQPFIRAIDAATATIDLAMFHLTDADVADALARAVKRGVHVRVIVDSLGLKAKRNRAVFKQLGAAGADARASSTAFSITHEKAMVVDHAVAFITAINLTRDVARTRDLGVVTHVSAVVDDVTRLFEADWANANGRGHVTPALAEPSLVVAPTTARTKLIALIASAQHELLVTVENLGDPKLEDALVAAAHRGVTLRIIVPMCDKNPNPLYNLPAARALIAATASVRLMPVPETADTPYMHSKMILVDGAVAYVGSINFSASSTIHARELGVIFANPAAAAQIAATFETDWQHAVVPPAANPRCPRSGD